MSPSPRRCERATTSCCRARAGLDARGVSVPGLTTAQVARRMVGVLQGLLIQRIGFSAEVTEQDFVGAAVSAVSAL